ncbi:MAG: hypothetical protein ABL967_17620 [Bryobacteraceae bacterium]
MTDAKFGAWHPEGSPVAVEYSMVAIEEIRQAVTDGFQKFSRGGIEVGGILYGTYEGGVTRILAIREIPCEHALGPSFQLSDNDKSLLLENMERDREDERLAGFEPVGWFCSHTRGEINLTASDIELFSELFPEPWHVTMVLKPGRMGAMRAGFFVREIDGTLHAEKSYLEFSLPERAVLPPRERGEKRPLPYENLPVPRAIQQEGNGYEGQGAPPSSYEAPAFGQYDTSVPQAYPEARKSRTWLWMAVGFVAIAAAAMFGLRYYTPQVNREPIGLNVLERDGQLQVQWSHTSPTVLEANNGVLEIVDGLDNRKVQLSSADLSKGSFTYARKTGDVQVRLEVRDRQGSASQESSHYLGAEPARLDASEADVMQLEKNTLQDEVARLREQNASQAARIQQLERTLTIMQTRLNLATGQR